MDKTHVTSAPYYLGLDVGTNSVGWAVTNRDYELLKCKGNAMWGARLFDMAQDASGRRTNRTNRRRLARKKQRLQLLELLFAPEIAKTDPMFLRRMEESALWLDDKTDKTCRFALFNDPSFTDKDYHRRYPTVYHLRAELASSREEHDIRLVFLALHHIIKSRGHFLYDTSGTGNQIRPIEDVFQELKEQLGAEYGMNFEPDDCPGFLSALQQNDLGVNAKFKLLREKWGIDKESEPALDVSSILGLLAGKSGIKLALLYHDESLADGEINSVSLKSDLDEHFDTLSDLLGDRIELLVGLKQLYDVARLGQMLQGHTSLSEAKVALYDKNRADLRILKRYVRQTAPKKYKEIFSEKRAGLNNYAAYSGYQSRSGEHSCKQEDFCKYLAKVLLSPENPDKELARIFREIKDGVFLTKLKGTDNGVVPYQLHRQELLAILENAASYLPFLNDCDTDGYTVREKIVQIFEFRIPYYVGPLSTKAGACWAVRFPGKETEKVLPWTFDAVIDREASSVKFIDNLVGRCTYTGEPVLPKDSLLYSEYMLLNELNSLNVNGRPIPVDVKKAIIRDLFEASRKPVTKKQLRSYLLSQGHIQPSDELGGVDERIKSSLRSFHDFRGILEKTGDRDMVEDIIRHVVIFGSDPGMLKKWLRSHTHGLDEKDVAYICRLKYADWGNLSGCLLTELYSIDPEEGTGEAHSLIDMLRSTNHNLMQLLSGEYTFASQAEEHRRALFGVNQSLDDRLDSMYIAPAVRRSVRQTLKIVDEIVGIRKAVPEKIFVEMARDSAKEMKGKRTESRKEKLLALYAACREQAAALLPQLEQEDENRLRSDKLYLYYTQFGKCMYSGEPIDLDALMDGRQFDIDHIFPRSRVKDNSLDNRVVVKNTLNREKTNSYPIQSEIRTSMKPFWDMLKKNGMISQKKYDRLVRGTALTEQELSAFVARQLVETQQSTKALTVLLQDCYGQATRIVFSKAGNVSDFRHDFNMVKCREVNDLHHAKDAYLNIVVGNVYNTRFTDRFFANIRNENYSLNRVFDYPVKGAWMPGQTIQTVRKTMGKNNPIITRMPREAKGKLFDLQPVSKAEAKIPRKHDLPVEKYGGYTGRYASFFIVVDHQQRKKRIRTIEPVYLYAKSLFEQAPEEYCRKELGLDDPRIIVSMIRLDSLLEIDGKRLFLTGGSDSQGDGRDIYDLSSQLIVDYEGQLLIKAIFKFLDRAEGKKEEPIPTARDGISEENLKKLYDLFLQKLDAPVYHDLFILERAVLDNNREAFFALPLIAKCRILKQIVLMLQCNAVIPNFTELCGKKVGKRIRKNCKLSGLGSAYLIHQSPTGLYEIKEDLLE